VFTNDVKAGYHAELLKEVCGHTWEWEPQTLYFGGGTPSLMPVGLLEALTSAIPGKPWSEATLECAPGTLTVQALDAWLACGINRVSLGVQSFVDTELRQVGRKHTADTVAKDLALLRAAGIDNLNIDLIAGLPGQTADSWAYTLAYVEKLAPPHVSVYIFEVDDESRLGNEIIRGGARYGAKCLPDEDLTAQLYENAVHRLAAMGLLRYEISNFARSGFESRHNMKYWQLEPYVGFGLDAHSFNGRERWSNPDSLSQYLSGSRAVSRVDTDPGEERFFVGLRLENGIEPTKEDWTRFDEHIRRWTDVGMLHREGSRLRLTPAAFLLSNEIMQDFVNV
jgi:oxygen-independent coproporphyrinogen-3 oxidase